MTRWKAYWTRFRFELWLVLADWTYPKIQIVRSTKPVVSDKLLEKLCPSDEELAHLDSLDGV